MVVVDAAAVVVAAVAAAAILLLLLMLRRIEIFKTKVCTGTVRDHALVKYTMIDGRHCVEKSF